MTNRTHLLRLAVLLTPLLAACADLEGPGTDVPLEVEGAWRATAYSLEATDGRRVDLVAQTGLSLRLDIQADGALAGSVRVNDPNGGLLDVPFTGRRSGSPGALAVSLEPPITMGGVRILHGAVVEQYQGNTLTWRFPEARWDFDFEGPRPAEAAVGTLVLTRVF